MPFEQRGALRFFYFSSLKSAGLHHAVVTRQGGISQQPWHSLNIGGSVGDDPVHVKANKRLMLLDLGFGENSVYDVWQVHGNTVSIAEKPRQQGTPQVQADIILTNTPGVTMMMSFADCVPVFLYDPVRNAAGIVHAGWQGTVKKAVLVAVRTMRSHFGSDPSDILAAIGPSIGPDHYVVGQELIYHVKQSFGSSAGKLIVSNNGNVHFDLWKANENLLVEAGVKNIELSDICTACNLKDWFSHRAENGRTGRFGALADLNDEKSSC